MMQQFPCVLWKPIDFAMRTVLDEGCINVSELNDPYKPRTELSGAVASVS
jgi:hypothetical protein